MDKRKLLKAIIILMIFIFSVDTIMVKFHWFFTIWWSDMPMHFLGGLWVGLFFIYVIYTRNLFMQKFAMVVSCVLLMGIFWEAFEFLAFNHIGKDSFNILDTLSDVFFDVSGGLCAILYVLVP